MGVDLFHAPLQTFAKRDTKWNLVEQTDVNAGNRKRSAFAARHNHLTQHIWAIDRHAQRLFGVILNHAQVGAVRFHTDRVFARVRATSACQFAQVVLRVDHIKVERFRARVFGHLQAFGNVVKLLSHGWRPASSHCESQTD